MLRKVGWQRRNASRGPPPDYVFFFGRSARSSRNSPGPFRSRRFLCCCSSAVADGSASLSICWPARSGLRCGSRASPLHELRSCQPQLDKPTDGLGAVRFIGLPRCPSVHIFTQFGRKPDCRHWVSPSGRPASLFRTTFLRDAFIFLVLPKEATTTCRKIGDGPAEWESAVSPGELPRPRRPRRSRRRGTSHLGGL